MQSAKVKMQNEFASHKQKEKTLNNTESGIEQ